MVLAEDSTFTTRQVAHLTSFLSRHLVGDTGDEVVTPALLARLLDLLCCGAGAGEEAALLELLQAGGWESLSPEQLERAARQAGYHTVLQLLYQRTGQTDLILPCYLAATTPSRQEEVWSWLESAAVSPAVLLQHIPDLARLDCGKLAGVLLAQPGLEPQEALDRLQEEPQLELELVQRLLQMTHDCSDSLQQRCLELLCSLQPDKVTDWLSSQAGETGDPEAALAIVTKHNLTAPRVLLLERKGEITTAWRLLYTDLQQKAGSGLEQGLEAAISLLERFGQRAGLENCWCDLLSLLEDPVLTRRVVAAALGRLPHTTLLSALLQHPRYSKDWPELRGVLTELLGRAGTEEELLNTTAALARAEAGGLTVRLVRARQAGMSGRAHCDCCGNSLTAGSDTAALVFRCGHGHHSRCLDRAGGLTLSSLGAEQWKCTVCPAPALASEAPTCTPPVEESVARARQFLQLYTPAPHYSTDHSLLKTAGFQLRLRPEPQQ